MQSDHDDTVSAQKWVNECFPEKDTICHITDTCFVLVAEIFKADGITDLETFRMNKSRVKFQSIHFFSKDRPYFHCNPGCNRRSGNAARLSACNNATTSGPS